jgi:hypothetical protein
MPRTSGPIQVLRSSTGDIDERTGLVAPRYHRTCEWQWSAMIQSLDQLINRNDTADEPNSTAGLSNGRLHNHPVFGHLVDVE